MPGSTGWPIVLVNYLYVKKDQTHASPKTAAALKAFILNSRDSLCQEVGFTEPSAPLRTQTLAPAASIVHPAGMRFYTSETDTASYTGMGDGYECSVLKSEILAAQQSQARAELAGGDKPSTLSTPSSPSSRSTPATAQHVASSSSSDDNQGDDDANVIVGLLVALVAILISVISSCVGLKELKTAKDAKNGPATNLQGHVYGQTILVLTNLQFCSLVIRDKFRCVVSWLI